MKIKIHRFGGIIILWIMFLFVSCKDDIGLIEYQSVPEGEPATISLKISLPSMSVQTRDAGIDPDGEQASTIY